MNAWRLRYALMLTDSLSSILFDARRNTCHCLLLNYWVRCGGLEVSLSPVMAVLRDMEEGCTCTVQSKPQSLLGKL